MVQELSALISQIPGITSRGRGVRRLITLLAVLLVPALVTAQSTGAGQGSSAQDDPAIRFRMPTVTVTAQKEPEDKQKIPVSVTAVLEGHDRERRHPHRERGRDLRARTLSSPSVTARKLSNRAFPRDRLRARPIPGITTYYRRRAAAQCQLVEHRAARRRSDRVRARAAERALRPQHARRARQRHERAAVAGELDRAPVRAVRQPRTPGHVRGGVVGTARREQAEHGRVVRTGRRDGFTVNDVTGNDIDSRSAFSAKGAAVVDPERRLGERA